MPLRVSRTRDTAAAALPATRACAAAATGRWFEGAPAPAGRGRPAGAVGQVDRLAGHRLAGPNPKAVATARPAALAALLLQPAGPNRAQGAAAALERNARETHRFSASSHTASSALLSSSCAVNQEVIRATLTPTPRWFGPSLESPSVFQKTIPEVMWANRLGAQSTPGAAARPRTRAGWPNTR